MDELERKKNLEKLKHRAEIKAKSLLKNIKI